MCVRDSLQQVTLGASLTFKLGVRMSLSFKVGVRTVCTSMVGVIMSFTLLVMVDSASALDLGSSTVASR